jgi:calcineurin-like phosphoesterase family protein
MLALLIVCGLALISTREFRSGARAQTADDESVTLVGAGDIANCDLLGGARATANLLDAIPGTIFTLGDHAYPRGTAKELAECYGPTWGRHKARTRPAIGNHDLITGNGQPYFDYFGEQAGPKGRGYYSYDLGAWHIIALKGTEPVGATSPQAMWLRDDLATHSTDCVLAYWHMPVFSSGPHGGTSEMREVWKILYDAGADVVVSSHDHVYERFAPMDANGKPDPQRGIREFLVGTGGAGVYKFRNKLAGNSEVHDNSTYGVLKFTLNKGRYAWEFVPMAGQKFTDSGSAACSPAR